MDSHDPDADRRRESTEDRYDVRSLADVPLEHHHVVRTWRPVCWGAAIADQGWQGWSGLCEGAVGRGEGCFAECHSENGPDDPPGILASWVEIRRGVPVVRGIRGMLTFEPDGDHVRAYGGSVRSW